MILFLKALQSGVSMFLTHQASKLPTHRNQLIDWHHLISSTNLSCYLEAGNEKSDNLVIVRFVQSI